MITEKVRACWNKNADTWTLLARAGVGAVAVTDGPRVVGVVTQRDLVNVEALLDHLVNAPEP